MGKTLQPSDLDILKNLLDLDVSVDYNELNNFFDVLNKELSNSLEKENSNNVKTNKMTTASDFKPNKTTSASEFISKQSDFVTSLLAKIEAGLQKELKNYNGAKEVSIEVPGMNEGFMNIVRETYKNSGFLGIKFERRENCRDNFQCYTESCVIFTIY